LNHRDAVRLSFHPEPDPMTRLTLYVWFAALILFPLNPAAGQQAPPETKKPQAAAPGGATDAPIDWDRARALFQRFQRGEKLAPDDDAYLKRALEARKKGQGPQPQGVGGNSRAILNKPHVDLIPLDEMTAAQKHEGEEGGLYGDGKNVPPEAHRKAAEAALKRIRPLDAHGKPDAKGKIAFISVSMSNATQEFSAFVPKAHADPKKSPQVTVVDCAQGGQAMAEWVDPNGRPWDEADRRIASAGVAAAQVQVVWVKLANKGPSGTLDQHVNKLTADTTAVLHNIRQKFPNVQIAYLGSRIYGGHANGGLNPEPYAYEGAFAVRRLIEDQIAGKPELKYDAETGTGKSPLLLWGPYLWADGDKPRKSDGLVWLRGDFSGDGVHPSNSGREKVAQMLLDFCKTNPLAAPWFTGK
jgi:hypothetical protein